MELETIAARIRATSGKNSQKYKEGESDGRQWLAEYADADDMEALLAIDLNEVLEQSEDDAVDAACSIGVKLGCDHLDAVFNTDRITTSYLQGFFAGVRSLAVELRTLL